jgi:uncharacterized iron-regulated membrane protein
MSIFFFWMYWELLVVGFVGMLVLAGLVFSLMQIARWVEQGFDCLVDTPPYSRVKPPRQTPRTKPAAKASKAISSSLVPQRQSSQQTMVQYQQQLAQDMSAMTQAAQGELAQFGAFAASQVAELQVLDKQLLEEERTQGG